MGSRVIAVWKSRYIRHPFTAHCISEQKISKFKREEKKEKKIFKKPSQDLTAAQNSTYSHSLILFKRKNIKPIRKILFPPPFVFCYYFSLTLFFLFLQSSHQT